MPVYICIILDDARPRTALPIEATGDDDAVAQVETLCKEYGGCTEAQLWLSGKRIFTYRPDAGVSHPAAHGE